MEGVGCVDETTYIQKSLPFKALLLPLYRPYKLMLIKVTFLFIDSQPLHPVWYQIVLSFASLSQYFVINFKAICSCHKFSTE